MKALWIPAALLSAMLLFALWTGFAVEDRITDIGHQLTLASDAAETERWSQARAYLAGAEALWEESSTFLHIIVEHEELEAAQISFSGISAALRLQDSEESAILLCQLSRQLRHIADTQSISIKNIL